MGLGLFFQENLMGQVLFLKEKCGFCIFLWAYHTGGKHFFSGKNNGATGFSRKKNDGTKTKKSTKQSPKTRPGISINFDPSLNNVIPTK